MVQYHFRTKEGPSLGPIGADEFRQRLDAGDIDDETMVWRSGMIEWMTYAALRAREQQSAQARVVPPSRSQVKAAAPAAAPRDSQFLRCSSCGQDWPKGLLTQEGDLQVCGNCQRSRAEAIKSGRPNRIPGGRAKVVTWISIGIISCAVMGTKLWIHRNDVPVVKGARPGATAAPAR